MVSIKSYATTIYTDLQKMASRKMFYEMHNFPKVLLRFTSLHIKIRNCTKSFSSAQVA